MRVGGLGMTMCVLGLVLGFRARAWARGITVVISSVTSTCVCCACASLDQCACFSGSCMPFAVCYVGGCLDAE